MAKSEPTTTHANAVLVTGGSGFIGRLLVKRLAQSGRTVVSMYHHRLPEPMANMYPVCSDLSSADLLGSPLRGVETVVHLAWENNLVGANEQDLVFDPLQNKMPRNVRLLHNLLTAMERVGTKRIVFVSANGADRRATTAFLKEKYCAEFMVLNSRIPEKIIVRPGIVCGGGGSHDRFLRSIVNVMKFPGVYPVPNFGSQISPLHVEDLAEVLKKSTEIKMDEPSAILEVVGHEQFRIEEIFRMVSERFAKGAKLQLRGMLGNRLMPFFEKSSKEHPFAPKLRHYLALRNTVNESTREGNPLLPTLPEAFHSFKEVLAENQSI